MLKQVCIIPFKRDFLIEFNNTPETDLERFESVDMMRIIENGGSVRMVKTLEKNCSVDNEFDLKVANKMFIHDTLIHLYN